MCDMLNELLKAVGELTTSSPTGRASTREQRIAEVVQDNLSDYGTLDLKDHDYEGRTCLHAAVQQLEDLHAIIHALLNAGASPNVADNLGETAVMLAASSPYDNLSIVKELIAYVGDEVDKRNESDSTSLHFAAFAGRAEVVRILLAAGASPNLKDDQGDTPLTLAMSSSAPMDENQRLQLAQHLIAAGAEVDAVRWIGLTSLHYACERREVRLAELLLSHGASPNVVDKSGINALFHAVRSGSVALVRRMIDAGADVNHVAVTPSGPTTALYLAIERHNSEYNVEMVRYLLERGADPNRTNGLGRSVLSLALAKRSQNQVLIIKLLLDNGANMYDVRNGETYSFFERLVSEGRVSIVQLFLKNGLDLARYNPRTPDDFSPLHIAISLDNGSEMLKLLLEHNSQGSLNLDHEDKYGFSPLCAALQKKSLDCAKMLLKAGANANHVDSQGRTFFKWILTQGQSESLLEYIKLLVETMAKDTQVLHQLFSDSFAAARIPNEIAAEKRLAIAKSTIKMRVLHESLDPVADPVEQEIEGKSAELQSYYKASKDEITLLKESALIRPISLYHVLTADEKFCKSVTDDLVFDAFDESSVKRRFPIYAEQLCESFESVKDMHRVWKESVNILKCRKTVIPAPIPFHESTATT